MNDPIELLTPSPSELDPALKRRVLDSTLEELRRQHRKRRWRPVTALAAALAAGVLVFAIVPVPRSPKPTGPMQVSEVAIPSAVALEWQALERPEESCRLYRQAGEQYLSGDDPTNAVRCYGEALDAATEKEREIDLEDDFLLMAIKHARKKESER